jgi:uncharacterized HAD superfamily protein
LKHFCLDIDNVLACTDEVMRRVIFDYSDGRVCLDYESVKNFNYWECTDKNGNSISREEWKAVHDLFSEPRYLWQISPNLKALKGLEDVSKLARLHVATTRLPKARRITVEWLQYYGFPAHDLHFLAHGEKHSSLRVFDAAVEDDYEQAKSFAFSGTPCLLVSHPWNLGRPHVTSVTWAKDWGDVTDRLLTLTKA